LVPAKTTAAASLCQVINIIISSVVCDYRCFCAPVCGALEGPYALAPAWGSGLAVRRTGKVTAWSGQGHLLWFENCCHAIGRSQSVGGSGNGLLQHRINLTHWAQVVRQLAACALTPNPCRNPPFSIHHGWAPAFDFQKKASKPKLKGHQPAQASINKVTAKVSHEVASINQNDCLFPGLCIIITEFNPTNWERHCP
jgi:hypothetical protein